MSFGLYFAITNILLCSIISYAIAPFVKLIGTKFNIVDLPNSRKVHKKPIVRIGGLTIFIVFSIYLSLTSFFIKFEDFDSYDLSKFYVFLIGGLLFFLIGIHDDVYKSSPFLRLCLQFIIAIFVAINGINFGSINIDIPYMDQFDILIPPIVSCLFSAIWIVAITNAINWIDGIDALAGGYCAILSLGICTAMLNQNNSLGILFSSVFLGCIIGFLIRNFKPAFYIMGDCGSNFLGYCLSTSSILFLPSSNNSSIDIIYLFIIFSLPLGDMIIVILERLFKKQNIFMPDKNHIHHRLMHLNIDYNYIILSLFSYSAASITIGLFYLQNN